MKPKPSDKPDEKMRDLCSNLYKDRWGKPYVLTDGQLKIFERIVKRDHPRVHLTTFTQYGKSATVALAVLTRAATYPEKWMIVAGREKQAKIIMSYIIEHTFDNDYTKGKLEIGGEDIERLQRERSKNRLTFRHADGGLGEIMILSADSRNQQAAGESLMGFGCIPAGYKISTDKGEFLIEDVVKNKMDVKILSYNHLTEETEYKEILEYQENPVGDRHILEFDCGEKFRCTNDHPVFVEDKGYIRADEVKEDDFIRKVPTLRGLYSRIVKKITRVETKSPYVYNLNVKDNHNYFIEGVLLHNSQNVVLDEAALIDDETEVKIFRMLGGFKDNFYLKIGNPFRRNHFWKDSLNPDWYHLNIDWKQGVKEGRIEESFIREAKQKPLFDILYENKFPPEEMMDEHGYIPIIDERDLVEVKDEQMTRSKVLGVDPAGEGRDEAKWVVRDAFKVKVVATEKISNPKSMAQRTMTVMMQEDIAPNNVFVDSFGVGAPLIAELARSGVPVNAVNVGDKMPKGSEEAERFFNKRAWMFWEFREWAKQGGVFVKNLNWKEILSVKFRAELDRRLKIMSKDEMRRKGILSPNTVDAAMLTFSNGKDILGRFKEYSGSSGNIVNSDQYSAI